MSLEQLTLLEIPQITLKETTEPRQPNSKLEATARGKMQPQYQGLIQLECLDPPKPKPTRGKAEKLNSKHYPFGEEVEA